MIGAIAEALGVTEGYLLGHEARKESPKISQGHMVQVTVLNAGKAGRGPTESLEREIYIPVQMSYEDYSYLWVEGDSMMPWLREGDIAIFRYNPSPRIGFAGAFKTRDGDYLIKEVEYRDRDGRWVLRSWNPKYEPIEVEEGTECLGYLVGFYRDVHGDETWRHNRTGLKFP